MTDPCWGAAYANEVDAPLWSVAPISEGGSMNRALTIRCVAGAIYERHQSTDRSDLSPESSYWAHLADAAVSAMEERQKLVDAAARSLREFLDWLDEDRRNIYYLDSALRERFWKFVREAS